MTTLIIIIKVDEIEKTLNVNTTKSSYPLKNKNSNITLNLNQNTKWIKDYLLDYNLNNYTDKQLFSAYNILNTSNFQDSSIYYIIKKKHGASNYYKISTRSSGYHIIYPILPHTINQPPLMVEIKINDDYYKIPKHIYNCLNVFNEMNESIPEAINDKILRIPDHYTPYIHGIIDILNKDKILYNPGELSLLDFLGFPIELIIDGFVFVNDKIISLFEAQSKFSMDELIRYGCTFIDYNIRYNLRFDNKIVPFDVITVNVAKLLIKKVGIANYPDSSEDQMVELLLLKVLVEKYKNKYI
jgi:mRNA-degrading endonuclease RelE of RelBE toxin-antitoxin system